MRQPEQPTANTSLEKLTTVTPSLLLASVNRIEVAIHSIEVKIPAK